MNAMQQILETLWANSKDNLNDDELRVMEDAFDVITYRAIHLSKVCETVAILADEDSTRPGIRTGVLSGGDGLYALLATISGEFDTIAGLSQLASEAGFLRHQLHEKKGNLRVA